MRLTLMPRASSRQPIEAAARPLPSEDTTPPVTKMYFADISASAYEVALFGRTRCARLSIATGRLRRQWALCCLPVDNRAAIRLGVGLRAPRLSFQRYFVLGLARLARRRR